MTERPTPGPKSTRGLAAPALSAVLLLACPRVESGVDPEALGYGPGPHHSLAAGYESDPVPRPAPTPWTPPARESERAPLSLGQLMEGSTEASTPAATPVPHTADVLRVCDRLAELGEPANERDACLRRFRIARVFRSIGNWKTLVSCIDASSNLEAAGACERATPLAVETVAEYPRESAVCLHLFALLILEEMGAEPMLDDGDFAEFQPLVRECVDSLVGETRRDRNPSEYVEVLACIERAQTPGAAEACESASADQLPGMND